MGKGNVFGDVDVVQKRNYVYSLKVNRRGSVLFKLKRQIFLDYFGQEREKFKEIKNACFETDFRLMKQLTVAVFGTWYSNRFK